MILSINTVISYVTNHQISPRKYLVASELENISYSNWAATEILDRLLFEQSRLPEFITGREPVSSEDIIESFIDEMMYFASISSKKVYGKPFIIAKKTAVCILREIRSSTI